MKKRKWLIIGVLETFILSLIFVAFAQAQGNFRGNLDDEQVKIPIIYRGMQKSITGDYLKSQMGGGETNDPIVEIEALDSIKSFNIQFGTGNYFVKIPGGYWGLELSKVQFNLMISHSLDSLNIPNDYRVSRRMEPTVKFVIDMTKSQAQGIATAMSLTYDYLGYEDFKEFILPVDVLTKDNGNFLFVFSRYFSDLLTYADGLGAPGPLGSLEKLYLQPTGVVHVTLRKNGN